MKKIKKSKIIYAAFIAAMIMNIIPYMPHTAKAELSQAGPISDKHGFPVWYTDKNSLALQPCLGLNPDGTGLVDPNCILPGAGQEPNFDPALSISFPNNFPSEFFYYIAEPVDSAGKPLKIGLSKVKASFRIALEGAFASVSGGPELGQQTAFLRINLRLPTPTGLTPNSVYTVNHPFGTFTFSTDGVGDVIKTAGQAFRVEDGAFVPPLTSVTAASFLAAPNTNIGPFLKAVNPAPPVGYVGNPLVTQTIESEPNGASFKITGPDVGGKGVNTIQTSLWNVSGKIANDTNFVDVTAPVITVLGANPAAVTLGSPYVDAGATAIDNVDGDLTAKIIVDNSVNINVVGTYTVTYSVSDAAGNKASATRTVNVTAQAPAAPATAGPQVGSTSDKNGFPVWYMDKAGTSLELCSDPANPLCVATPVIVGNKFSEKIGFGAESFWWLANTKMKVSPSGSLVTGGKAILVLGLEAAFLNGDPAPADQVTFGRLRFKIDVPKAGIYTITHPYGKEVFEVTDAQMAATGGISAINSDKVDGVKLKHLSGNIGKIGDVGCGFTPCDFSLALGSPVMSSFLKWDTGLPIIGVDGKQYIGDPAVDHTITGSPFGINVFRIDGPIGTDLDGKGHNFIETNLFNVQGRLMSVSSTSSSSEVPTTGSTSSSVSSDQTPPVITILGNNPETVSLGSVYTDAGATALDNLDGNLTAAIITVSSVDTSVAGSYAVTYSISDTAGNSASSTRTVNVVAPVSASASNTNLNSTNSVQNPVPSGGGESGSSGGSSSNGTGSSSGVSSGGGGFAPVIPSQKPEIIIALSSPFISNSSGKEEQTGMVLGASTFRFSSNLKPGMRGDSILNLQKLLKSKGFYKSSINGKFTLSTFKAIKSFQKSAGLKQTGKLDSATREKLNHAVL